MVNCEQLITHLDLIKSNIEKINLILVSKHEALLDETENAKWVKTKRELTQKTIIVHSAIKALKMAYDECANSQDYIRLIIKENET